MWNNGQEQIAPNIIRFVLFKNDKQLSFADVLKLWQQDESFILYFNQLLIDVPFDAYFWETPPVNNRNLYQPFEFVLVESNTLQWSSPNQNAYSKYFIEDKIVSFPNLKMDATLISPSPIDTNSDYAHLANFVRTAPLNQILAFWKKVGKEYELAINEDYLWLSTHGLGVSWLHVRIDIYPKYYHHRAYKLNF